LGFLWQKFNEQNFIMVNQISSNEVGAYSGVLTGFFAPEKFDTRVYQIPCITQPYPGVEDDINGY